MATAVFPVELPQYVLIDPSGTPQNNVYRTSTDSGPAKQRPKGTKLIEQFDQCQLYLTVNEYRDIFLPFFQNTIGNGALSFMWRHPLTDLDAELRFVNGAINPSRPSKDCILLNFSLETV